MNQPSEQSVSQSRLSAETYTQVFGTLYVGLAVNMLLTLTCLPCVALLALTDVATTWPLVAATAWLVGPALAATFGVFARFSEDGSTDVVRGFAHGWRRHFRRAAAVTLMATGMLVVLGVDIAAVWGRPIGAAAIPVFAVIALWVGLAALQALAGLTALPQAKVSVVIKSAFYLVVRRWHLTLVTIVALSFQAAFFAAQPVLALGLTAAPVLYLVWAGATFALDSMLERPSVRGVPGHPRAAAPSLSHP